MEERREDSAFDVLGPLVFFMNEGGFTPRIEPYTINSDTSVVNSLGSSSATPPMRQASP